MIYCLARKTCEEVANSLNEELGTNEISFYHAELSSEERYRRQQRWSNDDGIKVHVATVAFGMVRQNR